MTPVSVRVDDAEAYAVTAMEYEPANGSIAVAHPFAKDHVNGSGIPGRRHVT